jgi:NAD(P)-dependent dehydrogenase (short-subunit alcohol dehydrogenase family)
MGKPDGKVAIVTGAARGLGRAYAKRLAGLGGSYEQLTSARLMSKL